MKKLLSLLLLLPLLSTAQGIKFEEGLTWEQVKQKAKIENKFIFVDCYATWCVPCKQMDKEVYTNDSVGLKLNSKFISLKVQMDTSQKDDASVKKWYSDANSIKSEFQILGFPSFLFFSPDGKLVHRDVGFKNAGEFIQLSSLAIDPNKQFYTLLNDYNNGSKNYSMMPYMAKTARELKKVDLATTIAQDYLQNYLYKQRKSELFRKENIEFMRNYIQSSDEMGFKFFWKQAGKIGDIMNKTGYVKGLVDRIITKEEIKPNLDKLNEKGDTLVNWVIMNSQIKRKYSIDYADRNILNAQIRWYSEKKNWQSLARYQIEKIEKYGLDTAGFGKHSINNMIWDVFVEHITDKEMLNKAIGIMEVIVSAMPYKSNALDTYANLLYKVGRIKEAIQWEEIAGKLTPEDKGFKETLEKMKGGTLTW